MGITIWDEQLHALLRQAKLFIANYEMNA